MNGRFALQPIRDNLNQPSGKVVHQRRRIDATVRFEQTQPPIALAFTGADKEIAHTILTVEDLQPQAPVRNLLGNR